MVRDSPSPFPRSRFCKFPHMLQTGPWPFKTLLGLAFQLSVIRVRRLDEARLAGIGQSVVKTKPALAIECRAYGGRLRRPTGTLVRAPGV